MKSAYQKYKSTSVQSASKEKILLMLYEGAIKFTKLAIKAAEEKKIADKGYNIGRAYDIVMELNNSLDHKVATELSSQLEQLYMYILDEYTKGNISNDPLHFRNGLKILENLYGGWQVAVEKVKSDSDGNEPSTPPTNK